MSLLDKAKAVAKEAQERAKDTIDEVQTKRELAETYSEIGKKVVQLTDSGQLSNAELTPLIEKVRQLKAHLAGPAETAGATASSPSPPEGGTA